MSFVQSIDVVPQIRSSGFPKNCAGWLRYAAFHRQMFDFSAPCAQKIRRLKVASHTFSKIRTRALLSKIDQNLLSNGEKSLSILTSIFNEASLRQKSMRTSPISSEGFCATSQPHSIAHTSPPSPPTPPPLNQANHNDIWALIFVQIKKVGACLQGAYVA